MINMTDSSISKQLSFVDLADVYAGYNYSDYNYEFDEATKPCQNVAVSSSVMIVLCAFDILVFLLAVPGNLLVCFVIGLSKQPLSPSDIYLLHLAVADILLAFGLPFFATSNVVGWVFGNVMCKLVSVFQEISFYSSILFLACISVDRYLVIVHAMEAPKAARRRLVSWGACAAVWFVGSLLSLPVLFNEVEIPNGETLAMCSVNYAEEGQDNWRLATRGLLHVLGFVLPLTIMLACYGVTVVRLLRTRGSFQRQKAMRVIMAVVVAFLLCWTPYHLVLMVDTLLRANLVKHRCQDKMAVDKALFATLSLGLFHSCVNPVLYAFVGEKFRRKLLQMLRKAGVFKRRASVTRASRSISLTSEATSTFM
ncbi:hypothetical protein DPEC_G00042960 [Dallia pectoralis]|uniref:Uncharacterized protein n=1 Tax=Dallia pectoralis TaxID=75939 RepID=A0ACC2HA03_DALPE|nr:hypothetical protein DPEC_G00042960 [Dallia pectoralis]